MKRNKPLRMLRTCLSGMALLLLVMLLQGMPAFAVDFVSIATNNTWVAGNIAAEKEVDYYVVNVPKSGWLTVDYQGLSVYDSYVSFHNYDLTKQYSKHELYNSSDISPKNRTDVYALEPGRYAIKIWASGSHTGSYRVRTSFKAANNNESAANDKFETAQQLNLGQFVTGFLSIDDTVDFYRIHLNKAAAVRLIYTSYIHDSYFQIWNEDLIEVSKKEVYSASEESPKTYVYEQALEAGTYYVKIYPSGSNTGRYQLRYEGKELVKSITVSGNKQVSAGTSFTLKASVYPSNASNKEVTWTSGNTSVAYVDEETGEVSTYRPGTANITCQAKDGSNVTRVVKVIVLPKKLSTPYLYKKSKKSVQVSWDSQYNISGYQVQYSPYKSMKKAKTKKVSPNKNYVTIKKLKQKKYYFRVRAYVKVDGKYYYGKWSTKKAIKLRK